MTTDSLLARYTVITLKGDSVDGQDGRSYAQAGACRSFDGKRSIFGVYQLTL
jgi:hypothetical protein